MERMLEVFGPHVQLQPKLRHALLALVHQPSQASDQDVAAQATPRQTLFSLLKQLFTDDLLGYRASNDHFWHYSLRTAIAAEHVGQTILKLENTNILFLAGLVHDLGKFALDAAVIEKQDAILEARQAKTPPDSFEILEQSFMQDTHAHLSALLMKAWDLPEDFVAVVANHHAPSKAPQALQEQALAVHLGDMFAMMAGWGTEIDRLAYDVDPLADQHVKKDAKWELQVFPKLLLDIDQQYEHFLNTCNQDLGGNA